MSVFSGPEIVNNGLVLSLDAANPKSYPGSGTAWNNLVENVNGIVLAGAGTSTGDGDIYRSTDYGLTWTQIEMGSQLEWIFSLAYCGNGIFLTGTGSGTGDGDIYRSTDYGLTWTLIEMGAGLEGIHSFVYCGNGIVLAGGGQSADDGDIYRSTDYGLTWTQIEMGAGLERIQTFIYCDNGIVLAGAGFSTGDGDIYRSTDFGVTWTLIEMGAGLEYIHSLVYCGNGIVLGGGAQTTGDGDIYRSTDYGLTWTQIEMGAGLENIRSLLYSGNGNNGTLVNTPTYDTTNGGRLLFNGTNQYVTSTFATSAGQAITYIGWLYSTETTATYRNFVDSVTVRPMIWWNTSGQIEFDAAYFTTTPVYRNQWVQVALSKPAGSSAASYYVNGSLVGTGSAYSTTAVTPTWFNRAAAEIWKGYSSNYQVYNRALTAAEIQQNFNALRGRFGI